MNFKKILSSVILLALLAPAGWSATNKDRGVASMGKDSPAYIEKGHWLLGGSMSAGGSKYNNSKILVVEGINSQGLNFSVTPTFVYAFAKNFAFGVSAGYSRDYFLLENANLNLKDLGVDVNIMVTDYFMLSHNAIAKLFGRTYLPLGGGKRVAIFVDVALGMQFGQGKITDRQGAEIIGTYQTTIKGVLGVNPGLSAKLTPHFTLEAGLGIAGIGFSNINQIHNQVSAGTQKAFDAYFTVNPLNLNLGLYYSF